MRKLLRILLVILVLLIAAGVVGVLMIDSIAARAVQKGSTYALGVDTSVSSMSVGLISGQVGMQGFHVANPAGFTSPHLMKMQRFDLQVSPRSLMSPTVEVGKFELDGLDMNIERQTSGTNISKVMDTLKRLSSPEEKESQPSGKKVKVDRILIKNVVADIHQGGPIAGTTPITVEVPEIELNNVSSEDSGGVVVSELVARIMPAILTAVLKKAKGVVPDDLVNDLNGQLTSLVSTMGGQTQKLADQAAQDITKTIQQGAGKLLEGILPTKKPSPTP